MLKEDWEFFKQRRFIEEQVPCRGAATADYKRVVLSLGAV